MIHIALMTEFSFKKSFLHMKDIHKYVQDGMVGIADLNNTFGHVKLTQQAEKHNFKPIYGVRLHVIPDESKQRRCDLSWIFLAKNSAGLKEIYRLVQRSYEQFYYIPRLNVSDLDRISENVISIAPVEGTFGADYTAFGPGLFGSDVAIDNNNFPRIEDRQVYELLAGARKQGSGYSYNFLDQTWPQHIMSREEWVSYGMTDAIEAHTKEIAEMCNAAIPKSDMITWSGKSTVMQSCETGKHRIKNWTKGHEDRLQYEYALIKEKGYEDYFLIVADMIMHAKKTMLVGPARGSSAGSLICYLMGITETDPVYHNLIFERFIDENRFDLPDIDIDFPDHKRDAVVKYLKKKYKPSNVMCLATVSRLRAKSAIGEFAKSLGIPPYETEAAKGAIIERSSGDARAAMCITDTFRDTDPGKELIEKYPSMILVGEIENHAAHAGKHAAGILVATEPLCNYGALNPRDDVVMLDKKDAEYLGLLKIDCLGLRTLSILEGVAEQLGKPLCFYYDLPLDDEPTYKLFNDMRLTGIFQFEGQSLQMVSKHIGVKNFNDIAAITALARPGAMSSGGTGKYIKRSTGKEDVEFYSDIHKEITEETLGIVVYQEQMMEIARKVGGLSWKDTQMLRRASSKSLGDEFFGQYKEKFINGAAERGYSDPEAVWNDISASGSWSFNKSHAVSYGLVSYWTAWAKANHPLEFAVASLNHARSNDHAVKLLRDMIRSDGLKYVPVDSDKSDIGWTVSDGVLIGGLTNIKGIGVAKARAIIAAREGRRSFTPAMYKTLSAPVTDFDIIFPAKHYWGFLYEDPISYGMETRPLPIIEVDGPGEFVFLGCLSDRNQRDLNEHVFLKRRGGTIETDNKVYLNMKLEDDTDIIGCRIGRYQYESLGKDIAENGRLGKDWYLAKGTMTKTWRIIDIKEIVHLNKYFKVDIK